MGTRKTTNVKHAWPNRVLSGVRSCTLQLADKPQLSRVSRGYSTLQHPRHAGEGIYEALGIKLQVSPLKFDI